jgi:protein phosphatase
MGAFLSQPLSSKLLQRRGNKHFRVGSAIMQGWRESMEDAHSVVLSLEKHSDVGFFGIFDGHCGKEASKFCSDKMYKYIDSVDDLNNEEVVTSKIVQLDNEFMENNIIDDGTTAIFAITIPQVNGDSDICYKVIVGNIGDSRAVLGKNSNECIALSEDHKPGTPTEQRRIEGAGGFVSLNRVRGNLALSRAIGDRSYKVPRDYPPEKQQVTCIPDYKKIDCSNKDFIFIGCDGIYEGDIFTVESVIKWISNKLEQTDDLAKVTAELLDECLARGSRDNMSAMIVQFKDGTDYHKEKDEYIPGPFFEGPRHTEFQEAYKNFAEYAGITLEESKRLYDEKNQNVTTSN